MGRLTLKTFEKEDCEDGGSGGSNQWNCLTQMASCSELGYGVRSFRIERTRENEMGQCLVAAVLSARDATDETASEEEGSAWKGMGFSLISLVAAACGAIMIAW